jgi:DNA-binding NarL/FixJ family response regulator
MPEYRVSIKDFTDLNYLGLQSLLADHFKDVEVVDSYHNGNQPDLIISGKPHGWTDPEVFSYPRPSVLLIAPLEDSQVLSQVIRNGVDGFLTPECGKDEIVQALYAMKARDKFYCQKVIKVILNQQGLEGNNGCEPVSLTSRETQIVRLIARGNSTVKIAEKLNLSVHTINTHRKRIMKKLDLKSPVELIRYAFESGLA